MPRVEGQPRPLQDVADRHAEGAELIGGTVAVVVGQHLPLGVEVLRQAPVRVAGELVDDPTQDPQRAVDVALIAEHLPRGEHRLDGVHVGVDAAVVLTPGPGAVVLLAGHARVLVPEVSVEHVEGLGQQGRPRGDRRPSGSLRPE